MKVAVVGATGTIGGAIKNVFENNGIEVVAASRNSDVPLDMNDLGSIESFYAKVDNLDGVVLAAGNGEMGDVKELTDEQFQVAVNSKLMGQVNLVRKGLSKVKDGGMFILTGGIFVTKPWPGTSSLAVANGGVDAFARAAALDLKESHKINVIHPPLVRESAIAFGMDGDPYPPAAEVAETYLTVLKSDKTGESVFMEGYE